MQTLGLESPIRRTAFGFRQWFPVAAVGAATLLLGGAARAETRVALIASQSSATERLAPLIELRLGQQKSIALLERERIKEVVREQELQGMMAADGNSKRIALGKLLKADVLILMQGEEKHASYVRLTICEVNQGLRLSHQIVELSKSAETDADAIVQLVEKAIAKQQKPITDIVAVPPFYNNTLTFEGDHLKAACAKVVEGLLADRPGVLLVDLAEAQAIAQELSVVGDTAVQRRLPLYLMGEYRLEGQGVKQSAAFTLKLLRGTTELDRRLLEDVNLAKVPQQVSAAAGELFSKALGQAVQPPDPAAEAVQLGRRAQLAIRLGEWAEALPLLEAALLLKPDRWDLHGDALHCLNNLVELEAKSEGAGTWHQTPAGGRTDRLAKGLLGATLYHAERYLQNTVLADRKRDYYYLPGHCCERILRQFSWNSRAEYDRSAAEFEPVMAMARRVLTYKAANKVQDLSLWLLFRYTDVPINGRWGGESEGRGAYRPNTWHAQYAEERLQELRDRRLKLLHDFAWLKVSNCYSPGGGLDDMGGGPKSGYLEFLRAATEIPCVQRDAQDRIYGMLQKETLAAYWDRHPSDQYNYISRPSVPRSPKPPESNPEVVYVPIPLRVENRAEPNCAMGTCLPTVPGIDLFLGQSTLYLMKSKDVLRPLPVARRREDPTSFAGDVCFDGRYIWLLSPDPERCLAAIEPRSERIWKYTADDGLPPMDKKFGSAVTALTPGKICAAGSFGRTWCAIATCDPEKGISMKIFFEARDLHDRRLYPSEDLNKNVVVSAYRLATLNVPQADGKPPQQKVLLGKLLIDPEKPAVEKLVPIDDLLHVQGATVYWWEAGGQPCRMFSHTYPDFKRKMVQPNGRYGPCIVYQNRVYMWNRLLSVAESFQSPFRALRTNLSGDLAKHASLSTWCPALALSHHYGLILLDPTGDTYRVELLAP